MDLELKTPESFPAFPYDPPYSVQVDLMRHLYTAIEQRKITIVESPTGTGKTLSLLCASLTWLKDDKDRARKGELASLSSSGEIDWVVAQTVERRKRELEADERDYEERLAKARKREEIARRVAKGRVTKKAKIADDADAVTDEDEDDSAFLPEDGGSGGVDGNLSPAVRALMAKMTKRDSHAANSSPEPTCTKIYYASRTHSQLSQIITELEKLRLASISSCHPSDIAATSRAGTKRELPIEEPVHSSVRTVALGSRRQLCINEELRKKTQDLDEGCRELLNNKDERRCPHLPPVDDETRMSDFRDQILALPKDIEALADAGRQSHTCPYYGSRGTIPQAELVTLPYNLLLQKSAREALGIDLTNQVVIIDEAHNLISTLLALHTVHLPLPTLSLCLEQVSVYWSKFKRRLSASHANHIKRLITFLRCLHDYARNWQSSPTAQAAPPSGEPIEIMTVPELMKRLGQKVEGINLLDIQHYLHSSKIARKISSYIEKHPHDSGIHTKNYGNMPALYKVSEFMVALSMPQEDGRLSLALVEKAGLKVVELKYQLLNPACHFEVVLQTARNVILAGGTMSPMSDFLNQLFPSVPPTGISTFSCGHIVPSSHLQMMVISKGPHGGDMEFKYQTQNSSALVEELGQLLLNLSRVVPAGLVVFLSSYKYLSTLQDAWRKSGLYDKLRIKKQIFVEPSESQDVESILSDYSTAVSEPVAPQNGALLFAVIGAKLSEGLNFADDLARGVVVVGMPYPNWKSSELQERMNYVRSSVSSSDASQRDSGFELYENMCMNAVNQSIGRAIRHYNDWASLILVDRRYSSLSIMQKLPSWTQKNRISLATFGEAMKNLGNFYRSKK